MALINRAVCQESDRLLAERCGLPADAVNQLRGVFCQHPEVSGVTLYGSRAKGTHRNSSDVDLTLHGAGLEYAHFLKIEREIDDLLLPWKTDLSIFDQIENPELLRHIERVGIPFYLADGE